MSLPRSPQPARLAISLFVKEKELVAVAAQVLADTYGPVDTVSPWFAFDHTSYYELEMGKPLYRRILAFKTLVEQDDLSDIKLATNQIEGTYTEREKRRINIDPGYMVPSRFVLATGKDYAHRISIGKGIYADLTLVYRHGQYASLPWTYPDYADDRMRDYLGRIRSRYLADLRRSADGKGPRLQTDVGNPR